MCFTDQVTVFRGITKPLLFSSQRWSYSWGVNSGIWYVGINTIAFITPKVPFSSRYLNQDCPEHVSPFVFARNAAYNWYLHDPRLTFTRRTTHIYEAPDLYLRTRDLYLLYIFSLPCNTNNNYPLQIIYYIYIYYFYGILNKGWNIYSYDNEWECFSLLLAEFTN